MISQETWLEGTSRGSTDVYAWGVLPEKSGGGVQPGSQNPYPIYDQNLRFFPPYFWHDLKFDTPFMAWPLNQYSVSDLPYIIISLVQTDVP